MQLLYKLLGLKFNEVDSPAIFQEAFRDGFKAIMPTFPATFIWAVVTAVAMMAAGLSPFYVMLINIVVYASSAQLAVLAMLVAQAPYPIIWLAAAAVNLRFVIFSASLQPYFRHLNLPRRLFYGFVNGDMISMLFGFRYRNDDEHDVTNEQTGFYLGMATVNYVGWQIGCLIGIVFAGFLPESWGLELAASLTLLALVLKSVERLAGVMGCAIAAFVAVALHDLPYKLWLPIAIILGVAAALVVEKSLPNAYLKKGVTK